MMRQAFWAKLFGIIYSISMLVVIAQGQINGSEVDDLKITPISRTTSKLTWAEVDTDPCQAYVTYIIYRAEKEDFVPDESNRFAGPVFEHSYRVPNSDKVDTFYRVVATKHPTHCPPPTLKSGKIITFPLDHGKAYSANLSGRNLDCVAVSIAELSCKGEATFHASIASQDGHEFLIGCSSLEFEMGSWSCVNLGSEMLYSISVHSETATLVGAGFVKQNTKTGKTLERITPVFSILGLIR